MPQSTVPLGLGQGLVGTSIGRIRQSQSTEQTMCARNCRPFLTALLRVAPALPDPRRGLVPVTTQSAHVNQVQPSAPSNTSRTRHPGDYNEALATQWQLTPIHFSRLGTECRVRLYSPLLSTSNLVTPDPAPASFALPHAH